MTLDLPQAAPIATLEPRLLADQNDAPRIAPGVARPNEPPLGSLTSTEEEWLATAFDRLQLIYKQRETGSPGNSAFCIFQAENYYVQFLARHDAQVLFCEAVSPKSNPQLEVLLATTGDAALRKLGFNPPGVSPNYSQQIKVDGPEELAYAARLAFRVLKHVYHAQDIAAVTFKINLPNKTPRVPTLKAVLQQFLNDLKWEDTIQHEDRDGTDYVRTVYKIDSQLYDLILIADEKLQRLKIMLFSRITVPQTRVKDAAFLLNFFNVGLDVGNLEVSENGSVCFRWAIDVEGATASPKQCATLIAAAAPTFSAAGAAIGTVAFTKQSTEDIIKDFVQMQQQKGPQTVSNAPTSL